MAKSQSKRATIRPKSSAKLPPVLAQFSQALESLDVPNFASDVERAQELFYEALDARTAAKRRKLLEQSLALDPRNADVRLVLLDEQTLAPAARIDALRSIVATALASARKVNPHLEPYLNGRQRIPVELPGHYSPGSHDEAVCFAESMRSAWSTHPEALRWLQSQS